MSSSHRDDEGRKIGCGPMVPVAILLVFVVLVGYVLSIGPAAYLIDNGIIEEDPLVYFYLPIIWLAQAFEPVEHVLEFYLELWTQ